MTVASGSAEGEKKMTNGYDDIINMRLLNHGLTHKEDRIDLIERVIRLFSRVLTHLLLDTRRKTVL